MPKDLAPPDAVPDRRTGGLRSPLAASNGTSTLAWTCKIPARLAPVYLAFKLHSGEAYIESRHGPHFAVPVGMGVGDCTKLGAACPASAMALPKACSPRLTSQPQAGITAPRPANCRCAGRQDSEVRSCGSKKHRLRLLCLHVAETRPDALSRADIEEH